jgi:selenide,water dikinase
MALAILGMPVDKIAPETVRMILEGGREICTAAGIPIAGGHSIDCPEPVYGLAVIGTCKAENIRRNADAKPGDTLILTKPLGVGIYSAAIKKDKLPDGGYADMIATTTRLNKVGTKLGAHSAVHAMTDVTGFGLLGHALEVARGSKASLVLDLKALPVLKEASQLAQQGCVTGASHRNWASYGASVTLPPDCTDWQRHLLTDPQTSGGLLVSCKAAEAQGILETIRNEGYAEARIIGRVEAGPPVVRIGA